MTALASPLLSMSQFTGDYAPENWTFTSQDLTGQTADGSIDLSNMPTGFTITGNDDGLSGANSLYTITVPANGTIKFAWSYTTNDGAFYDKAGYKLNGIFVELTDPNDEDGDGQNGEEHVVVSAGDVFSFVVDATDACCGRGFLTVDAFSTADNTLPTLNALSNIFSDVNPGPIDVSLEGITAGIIEPDQVITITATSSNPSVIPNPVITYTSPEATGTLSFTPVTDAFGDATITVNVMDDGGTGNGSIDNIDVTFTVSIASNLPPAIDIISDIESQVNEVLSVDLEGINAGPGETQTISITAVSSDQTVIADADIVANYTSPDETGTLDITPVASASGEAIITVTVSDDGGTGNNGKNETTTSFTVTIAPNGEPTINELENLNLFADAGEQIIEFDGIDDGDSEADQQLSITVASSNEVLIPIPVITYTSPSEDGTLTFTPATGQFGTSTVTVTVSDNAGTSNGGLNEITTSFLVTVLGNFPPQINSLSNIQIGINEPNRSIDLTGISAGIASGAEVITVSASSGNTGVIAEADIEVDYTSPEETGTLVINPVTDVIGESEITVTVMDDAGTESGGINTTLETFVVRILANRAPSITQLDALGLDVNSDQQTVELTGITSGEDSDYQTLTVTATSDNTDLIPNPDVTYISPETAGSLTFTPVTDAVGTANITVTVADDGGTLGGGVNSTSMTFEISVSGNQAPTVNTVEDIFRNSADPFSVNLGGISDGTGLEQTLIITATSDNPTIIPDPTVNYTGGSATGSLDFVPTDFGNATITLTIADDGGTENGGVDTFTQTFNINLGENDPPSISEFQSGEDLDGATYHFNNGQGDQAIIFNVEDDDHNISSVSINALSQEFENVASINYNSGSFLGGIIFSPTSGQTGVGEFEVTVQDDGGTDNNGIDTFVATLTVVFTEPTTYTASLSSDEDENHIQPFTVDQSGTVFIENFEGDFDAFFTLYENTFDPQNPESNQIEDGRTIAVELQKDVQYILVTTNSADEEDVALTMANANFNFADETVQSFTNAIGVLNGDVGFGFLPNLDFIENVITDEDEPLTIPLSGISDGNGGTDNLSLSGISEGIGSFEFADNLDGTAEATLNPVLDFNGNTSVIITVTSEDGSSFDRVFEMVVNPVNDAPVLAAIGDQIVDEESELTFTASATDVDSPDNTLAFSLDATSTGNGMAIDAATGVFTWTPETIQIGSYSVGVTVSDGDLNATETITIIVSDVLGLGVVNAIQVYPNPTADFIQINSDQVKVVNIINMNGKLVKTSQATEKIDMSGLSNGVFILNLIDAKGDVVSTNRIVKQ